MIDKEEMLARYQRAQQLDQGFMTKRVAFNTALYPHWLSDSDSDSFWYARETRDGQSYRVVDAKAGTNKEALNHNELLKNSSAASPNHKRSPDGQYAVFSRDYNLWLENITSSNQTALTTDGSVHYAYAGTASGYGRQEVETLEAVWSPDSTRVLLVVKDNRQVKVAPPLVEHVPQEASLRPTVIDPDRRVAFPGDEHIEVYHFVSIEIASGKVQFSNFGPSPVCYPSYLGYFTGKRGWWRNNSRHAYLLDCDRDEKTVRLLEFDTHTGQVQVVIEDKTDTPTPYIPFSHIGTLLSYLPDSNELLWYSPRSGWAHLYRYDLNTGQLKNAITQGEWLVRNVLHCDVERRELWIQTAGRDSEKNPYYSDICRVNIDTGELTEVQASDHDYAVSAPPSRIGIAGSFGVSPSGNYVVATRSRVDQAPVSLLLDRDGHTIMTLETADVSGLPDHWQWPESVKLKAADGTTDTWGVVFRPSDFSPDKQYPVIDCSYHSFMPIGAFNNNLVGAMGYLPPAALAELGFIVVMINSRGTGLRDSVFNASNASLAEKYHQEDCIAGIKQLAERYAYMDISRVGVGGFSSISMALTGLFKHPDFYTVGVSTSPGGDGAMNSAMVGMVGAKPRDEPALEALAKNLRGKLLLIHGMNDNVCPVAITFRLIEALQQANKTFDMLLLPNMGHDPCAYSTRRMWDYFVQHLLGEQPPTDFKLTTGIDLYMAELANDAQADNAQSNSRETD